MWPLIIVSSFAIVFVLWMAVVIRRSPRREPLASPADTVKNAGGPAVVWMMMMPMFMSGSGG
jgi:hypothetical protein